MREVKILLKRTDKKRVGWPFDFYYEVEISFRNSDLNPIKGMSYYKTENYKTIKLIKKICFNNKTHALLFISNEPVIKHIALLKIHFDEIQLEVIEKQLKRWKITEQGVKNDLR